MNAAVLLALLPVVFGAAIDPASICQTACFDLYDPVCGSDGKTYSNDCYLSTATCLDSTVTKFHHGECQQTQLPTCPVMMCPMNYDPVCGTDGKTYGNTCSLKTAHCHGDVTISHHGSCDSFVVSK